MIIELIDAAVQDGASEKKACELLGLAATTIGRWRKSATGDDERAGPRREPLNKLSPAERLKVVKAACSPEFRDKSPSQIVPTLADRGLYIASESTFYRVLQEERLAESRGKAKTPRKYHRPSPKVATGPRQIWTWDITYLRSPVRGMFYYAYIIVDIWSRKIVAAEVHAEESSEHAAELMMMACADEGVSADSLTLHADNGGPMKGSTMVATLQKLGVQATFSRPRVSDDNPYSEALFRTLKYRPEFPNRPFVSLEEARTWVRAFVAWYNEEHLHSAIRFVTPISRHEGDDVAVLKQRKAVYEKARRRTPSRWAREIRDFGHISSVTLHPQDTEERATQTT